MVQFHDRTWGPDVSSWQGAVDWAAVKADGASFAITKATEGVYYINPFADSNWKSIRDAGLIRVQYHYARPGKYSASEEAAYFLADMLPLEPGDIVALDLEIDSRDGAFSNGAYWAMEWMTTVQARVGFAPMLYSNGGVISDPAQRFASVPEMGQRNGLWLANWGEVFPKPYAPWDTVALWQFTNAGQVPGIAGNVDLNIFNGDVETMRKYGMPAPAGNSGDGGVTPSDELYSRLNAVGDSLHNMAGEMANLISEAYDLAHKFGNKT